jgi:death-on-curing family protein
MVSMLATLTVDEVLSLHEALARHFEGENDPIQPAGVRSIALLESAVGRQFAGVNGVYRYADPRDNAATLMYGLCMNHPFYNGNKRVSLVAGLIHLDRNGYIPDGLTHDEIYRAVLALASHRPLSGKKKVPTSAGNRSEIEVEELSAWLRRKFRKEDKRIRPITYRELRRILNRFGLRVVVEDYTFKVFRDEESVSHGFLGLGRPRTVRRTRELCQIGCGGEGRVIKKGTLAQIRRDCRLTPEDGVDARAFYDDEAAVDFILNQYRGVLTRLARV